MLIHWCCYKHTVCLSIYSSIKIIFCSLFLCLTCEICFSNINYYLQNMMLTDFPCICWIKFLSYDFPHSQSDVVPPLIPSAFFFLVWWAIYWNVDEFEQFNVLHHSGTGICCFSSYLLSGQHCYFDSSRCAKTSFVISNTFHGADSVSFSLSASTLAITKITTTFPMNGNVR